MRFGFQYRFCNQITLMKDTWLIWSCSISKEEWRGVYRYKWCDLFFSCSNICNNISMSLAKPWNSGDCDKRTDVSCFASSSGLCLSEQVVYTVCHFLVCYVSLRCLVKCDCSVFIQVCIGYFFIVLFEKVTQDNHEWTSQSQSNPYSNLMSQLILKIF